MPKSVKRGKRSQQAIQARIERGAALRELGDSDLVRTAHQYATASTDVERAALRYAAGVKQETKEEVKEEVKE